MAKNVAPPPPKRVTRDDIERGFRDLQGDVRGRVEEQRSKLITAVAAGGFLVVLIIFFLGRRSGRKKNTIVEIRRL